MEVGKSVKRVDAFDKVTGRCKYTDDLCDKSALIAKVVHSTVANGKVLSVDTSEAEKVEGVVKIVTCFDVPKNYFPTAGHPWSTDESHQDVSDRLLLTDRPLFYGDDIVAVVAENEIAANRACSKIKIEYEEYPIVLDPIESMKDGAPLLHENYPNNILKHTQNRFGNYEEAIKEEGLIKFDNWYETPIVQHSHIENHICYAYEENGRIVCVTSTQIPHIVRRVCGQALGIDWGQIRIIKPYIGGGFGNKQDALYEPLCCYLTKVCNGRLVKLDTPREVTFTSNRTRHSEKIHIVSYCRPDGTFVARKYEVYSNQGAYTSHGHAIAAKGMNLFHQLYPCENVESDSYTVYTNLPVAGAMRGYGVPQAMFAIESDIDTIAKGLNIPPEQLRKQNLMPKGYVDAFSKNCQWDDSLRECIDKAKAYIDYDKKYEEYMNQTGNIRKGVGLAVFWYNTGVWPISLESSSSRMVLNQDGTIQLQLGETEIGQGADTAFSQMAAEAVGVTVDKIHILSCQDTDVTPFGTGAYASRQTYIAGFTINQTGKKIKDNILSYCAEELTEISKDKLDIVNNNIINTDDNSVIMDLKTLATTALYNTKHSEHIHAETTFTIQSNAYSFGACACEVEVDIAACKCKLEKIINVHDCGKLINPALAEAQVHGGMSMGIGFALSEEEKIDSKTGRVLNNNLLDYKLSTFMDHPHLEAQFVENAEPTSPFGTKALGEPPACPVAPAIRNAILHATGVGINKIPMTPHVLFKEFKDAGLIKEVTPNV